MIKQDTDNVYFYIRRAYMLWILIGFVSLGVAHIFINLGKYFIDGCWYLFAALAFVSLAITIVSVWCLFVLFLHRIVFRIREPKYEYRVITIKPITRIFFHFPYDSVIVTGSKVGVICYRIIGYRYFVKEVSYAV